MVKVKIQKRPSGTGDKKYFSYVITLPRQLVESVSSLKKAKYMDVELKGENIILKPI